MSYDEGWDNKNQMRAIAWLFLNLFEAQDYLAVLQKETSTIQENFRRKLDEALAKSRSNGMDLVFRAVAGVPCPAEVSEAGLKHITDVIEANPCLIDLAEKLKATVEGVEGLNAEIQRLQYVSESYKTNINDLEKEVERDNSRIAELQAEVESWKSECSRLSGAPSSKNQILNDFWKGKEVVRLESKLAAEIERANRIDAEYLDLRRQFEEQKLDLHALEQRRADPLAGLRVDSTEEVES